MLFSTVLKSRLERYFKKIGECLELPVAIVDSENSLIMRNDLFQSDVFEVSGNENGIIKRSIFCENEQCYLIAKLTERERRSKTVDKNLDLIEENIIFFIQQENEAQGLAQEMLDKYEELNLLYDMISELSTIFDEAEICRVTLARAIKVINVGCGAIAMLSPEKKELTIVEIQNKKKYQFLSKPEKLLSIARLTIEMQKEILYGEQREVPEDLISNLSNKELWTTMSVPIQTGDSISGALILIGKINNEVFNSGDIKLLSAIASYAGITINSNRMVEQMRVAEALQHEIKLAQNIQQSLLPRETPDISNLEIAGVCLPAADVGGDLFHFSKLQDDYWGFAVADVSGHGIGAALTMASLRSTIRSESRDNPSPNLIIKNVNSLMCGDTQDTGMYATLFCTAYNEKTKRLIYTNAGHPKPYLFQSKNQKVLALDKGGLPVGMFEGEQYENGQLQLNKGDILVIYTDGLTEARNETGEFYNENRLLEVIQKNIKKTANNLLEMILDSVKTYQGNVQQKDDITIVVLKVT
jgi:phosphoserine phosphatase RsbU/P